MKNHICLLIATVAVLSVSTLAYGDGKAFFSKDRQTYFPALEHEQRATIAYKDGIEHLVLAITLDLKDDEHGVWIFPVLGNPNQIRLSLIDRYPQFNGEDPREIVAEKFDTVNFAVTATQVWPILVGGFTMAGKSMIHSGTTADAWGIHTEIVGGDSIEELQAYLTDKGTNISRSELETFNDYIGKNHSLIVAWISSKESAQKEFAKFIETGDRKERCPCVYVQFPTDRPFFPLKPTSTYGEETIGVFITAIGHWKSTSDLFTVHYYEQEIVDPNLPSEFQALVRHPGVSYTLFEGWNVTAKYLEEDLWLEPTKIKGWDYAKFWGRLPKWVWPIMSLSLLISLSYCCGGLMGMWALKSWKSGTNLGLWNVLSIVAFIFAIKYSKGTESIKKSMVKYFMFVLDFSLMFTVLSTIIVTLIQMPLAWHFGAILFLDKFFILGISLLVAIVPIAAVIILVVCGKTIYKKLSN